MPIFSSLRAASSLPVPIVKSICTYHIPIFAGTTTPLQKKKKEKMNAKKNEMHTLRDTGGVLMVRGGGAVGPEPLEEERDAGADAPAGAAVEEESAAVGGAAGAEGGGSKVPAAGQVSM